MTTPAKAFEIPQDAVRLCFQIKNGHENTHYFAYYLEYLVFHLPEQLLVPALEWLVKNKITGEKFIQFVHGDCARSGLELVRHLTMRLEREKKIRKLYVTDIRR